MGIDTDTKNLGPASGKKRDFDQLNEFYRTNPHIVTGHGTFFQGNKVLDLNKANELFLQFKHMKFKDPRGNVSYRIMENTEDACFIRARLWAISLSEQGIYNTKYFIIDQIGDWSYHVAPAILVQENNETPPKKMILGPCVKGINKPLTVEEWQTQVRSGKPARTLFTNLTSGKEATHDFSVTMEKSERLKLPMMFETDSTVSTLPLNSSETIIYESSEMSLSRQEDFINFLTRKTDNLVLRSAYK